jgi:hypothetical protein
VPTVAALGFSRADRAVALGLPHAISVTTASVTAVVVAVLLSPRFPIGLGRRIDPDVGWHFDLPIVLGGSALVALVLGTAVAWSAWRSARAPLAPRARHRAGIGSRALELGAPVTVSTGVGFALDPGRGARALPTRPAVIGAIVGVTGVIGGLTLAAAIADASENPERFGTVWDIEAYSEDSYVAIDARAPQVADVPGIDAVARLARFTVPVGDAVVRFYALDDVEGSTKFVLLDGAPPRPGEVALGPDSADTFGVDVGDQVQIGAGGRFRVSGLALLPTTPHSSYDQGGWLHPDDLVRSIPPSQREPLVAELGLDGVPNDARFEQLLFEHGSLLAGVSAGADTEEALRRMQRVLGPEVTVDRSYGPADQQNLHRTRPLPLLFAAFALVVATGALLHISSTVVRRRRHDLAVLRAIGLTRRQARACVAWQATTLAAIGLVVGVPLGVAIGRLIWRTVAEETPMVYVQPAAALAVLLAVPTALVVANLLGALPAQRAAQVRPAHVLRTE